MAIYTPNGKVHLIGGKVDTGNCCCEGQECVILVRDCDSSINCDWTAAVTNFSCITGDGLQSNNSGFGRTRSAQDVSYIYAPDRCCWPNDGYRCSVSAEGSAANSGCIVGPSIGDLTKPDDESWPNWNPTYGSWAAAVGLFSGGCSLSRSWTNVISAGDFAGTHWRYHTYTNSEGKHFSDWITCPNSWNTTCSLSGVFKSTGNSDTIDLECTFNIGRLSHNQYADGQSPYIYSGEWVMEAYQIKATKTLSLYSWLKNSGITINFSVDDWTCSTTRSVNATGDMSRGAYKSIHQLVPGDHGGFQSRGYGSAGGYWYDSCCGNTGTYSYGEFKSQPHTHVIWLVPQVAMTLQITGKPWTNAEDKLRFMRLGKLPDETNAATISRYFDQPVIKPYPAANTAGCGDFCYLKCWQKLEDNPDITLPYGWCEVPDPAFRDSYAKCQEIDENNNLTGGCLADESRLKYLAVKKCLDDNDTTYYIERPDATNLNDVTQAYGGLSCGAISYSEADMPDFNCGAVPWVARVVGYLTQLPEGATLSEWDVWPETVYGADVADDCEAHKRNAIWQNAIANQQDTICGSTTKIIGVNPASNQPKSAGIGLPLPQGVNTWMVGDGHQYSSQNFGSVRFTCVDATNRCWVEPYGYKNNYDTSKSVNYGVTYNMRLPAAISTGDTCAECSQLKSFWMADQMEATSYCYGYYINSGYWLYTGSNPGAVAGKYFIADRPYYGGTTVWQVGPMTAHPELTLTDYGQPQDGSHYYSDDQLSGWAEFNETNYTMYDSASEAWAALYGGQMVQLTACDNTQINVLKSQWLSIYNGRGSNSAAVVWPEVNGQCQNLPHLGSLLVPMQEGVDVDATPEFYYVGGCEYWWDCNNQEQP